MYSKQRTKGSGHSSVVSVCHRSVPSQTGLDSKRQQIPFRISTFAKSYSPNLNGDVYVWCAWLQLCSVLHFINDKARRGKILSKIFGEMVWLQFFLRGIENNAIASATAHKPGGSVFTLLTKDPEGAPSPN